MYVLRSKQRRDRSLLIPLSKNSAVCPFKQSTTDFLIYHHFQKFLLFGKGWKAMGGEGIMKFYPSNLFNDHNISTVLQCVANLYHEEDRLLN